VTALRTALDELRTNPQQSEALDSEGNCVVLAPPGSGKTKLLTVRLARDLRDRIPEPHGAACITYTNAAAGELVRRVAELGAPRRSNLFIGTVHAFAIRAILRPYGRLTEHSEALAPIATNDQRRACYREAESEFYEGGEDTLGVEHTVQLRRQHLNYDPSDVGAGGERIAKVAERWDELLAEAGLVDFDGVVRHAVAIVEENEWVRRALAARFPRLFLDEYQDLAPGLDRLARALCFDEAAEADMFAVGDPDQSIMGFNGSRPELLQDLADQPRVHCVRLETNYRSRGSIVTTALQALGEDRSVKWLEEGGDITLHECDKGPDEQFERMVRVIESESEADTPLDQVAVLCPNNYIKRDAARALEDAGIPAFVRGDEYRETPTTSLIEGLAAWATQPRGESGFRFGNLLSRWRMVNGQRETLRRDIALVELLTAHGGGDRRAGEFVAAIVALGLRTRLRQTGRSDELEEVDKMLAVLTTGDLRRLDVAGLGLRGHAPGQVHMSTIHAGKGLEFEAVLVVGLDEGDFPSYWAKTERELEDARRAFYVSLTRAKRRVDLFYSGFRVTQAGKRQMNGRCRFLDYID
jgi:DNA helicase-2/ATP-dependent DNA helicase PcrA